MDVYFRHFAERYTDDDIADRLCMTSQHVKELRTALEMRDSMNDVKVTVPIEYKTDIGHSIEVPEEKTIDFDVVQPSKLILIAHAPKEKQLNLTKEVAEKGLTLQEVQAKVVEANIEVGKHTEKFVQNFECPLCGSKISKKKFEQITRKEVE